MIREFFHQYVRPLQRQFLIAIFLMLGESLVALANPRLAGLFAEGVLGSRAVKFSFEAILWFWLFVLLAQALLNFGSRVLIAQNSERILTRFRTSLYDHIQALPLPYFDEKRRGEWLALLTRDTDFLSNFVTGPMLTLLPQLVILVGALFLIFQIDSLIGVLISILVPFYYFILKIFGRKVRPLSKAIMDEYSQLYALADENLQMLPIVKSYTREVFESDRFRKTSQKLLDLVSRHLWIQSIFSPAIQFITASSFLFLLWLSSHRFASGQFTSAELVSMLLYGLLFARPVSTLADFYGQAQYARGVVERLSEIFSLRPETFTPTEKLLAPVKGDIEFVDVKFRYPGREEIFSGIHFSMGAGEILAITGENGAGKSTIVHLLQRFISPTMGSIKIDGTDISTVSLFSLRDQIGVVSQNLLLLNGTVRENIAYARPLISESAIVAAAELADAMTFIRELPDGLETVIGDQGVRLSGGQKQRIALARALMKNPPILVLDEATAMFDPEGEENFMRASREFLRKRTVLIITHRPSILAFADRVLILENGRLREKEDERRLSAYSRS